MSLKIINHFNTGSKIMYILK